MLKPTALPTLPGVVVSVLALHSSVGFCTTHKVIIVLHNYHVKPGTAFLALSNHDPPSPDSSSPVQLDRAVSRVALSSLGPGPGNTKQKRSSKNDKVDLIEDFYSINI